MGLNFLEKVPNKILLFGQDQVNALVAKAGDPTNDKEMAKALQKAIGKSNLVFFFWIFFRKRLTNTTECIIYKYLVR